MALSDEQAKAIKVQLLEQIEKLPKEQQDSIKESISKMNLTLFWKTFWGNGELM